jgi:CubicO group peptidase (beta-lactamase class C family)
MRLARGFLALGLLALGVPVTAQAQSAAPPAPRKYTDVRPVPDTPALRRAQEVVAVLNSGDPARVKTLVETSFARSFREGVPLEDHLSAFAEWMAWEPPLEVYGARTYDPPGPPTSAVLVVRSATRDAWRAVVVEVEPQAPHGITSVDMAGARLPTGQTAPAPIEAAEVAKQLGAYVDRLAKEGLFSGTVLLEKDGKALLTRAAGIANRDFGAPVRLDTKFNLGSMNKMFTGVAAMLLTQQGKISLDDPIAKYLDETWIPKVDKTKVMVKHLLTHTSGLGSYFNDAYDRSSRLLFRSVSDYKPLVAEETLRFEPGTDTRYSNTGMLIAGAVIEKASGMDYFEFVRRNIYAPAGMTNTDCYELDKVNPNLAVGYERRMTATGLVWRNNIFDHVLRGGPAGGGYSTVEDLDRFATALRSGKLLNAASRDELLKPRPEIGSPDYGLGFGVDQTPLGRRVGHSGGFLGISANLDIYLDTGWTVAVLSNLGGAAQVVTQKANGLILQGR